MGARLSPLDTMFLDLEEVDDGATMHIAAALVFDPPPDGDAPDVDRVRSHIAQRLHTLPRYRRRLSAPRAGRVTWRTWEEAPSFDVAAHVGHATLPAPGGTAELEEWFGDFLSHRLDRRRPLWEMALLDGLEDGRWALATKTHHCLVDGMGSVDVGQSLLDPEPSPPRHPQRGHWTIAPPPDDHALLRRLYPETLIDGAKAGADALRHPVDTLARGAAAADLVLHEELVAAPDSSLSAPLGSTRSYRAVHVELDQLKAIRSALGGTVNDAVLAVSTGALRHLLLARGETPPAAGLRAQVPVDIRTEGDRHALGNVLTSLFVELPVAERDPLVRYREVVERAAARKAGPQARGGKALVDLARHAPPFVGELLGRAMFGWSRTFNVTITNVRASPTPQYAFGARMRSVLPYVPLFAGHTVGIAVVSYAGGLTFGLGADRSSTPDIDQLAEGVESTFAELRRIAGV